MSKEIDRELKRELNDVLEAIGMERPRVRTPAETFLRKKIKEVER